MNYSARLFDQLLSAQAKLFTPFEAHLFDTPEWRRAHRVLDFGCGNASYVASAAAKFPEKQFVGFEIDPELADYAKRRESQNLSVVQGDLSALPRDGDFDFVLLRFVALHMEDRSELRRLGEAYCSERCAILTIDAEDRHLKISPQLPELTKIIHKLLEGFSKNRGLRKTLDKEWSSYGFANTHEEDIVIDASRMGDMSDLVRYLDLNARLLLGDALPEAVNLELNALMETPGLLFRFGYFARLNARSRGRTNENARLETFKRNSLAV